MDVPVHPVIADIIDALDQLGFWAAAYDTQWRVVAETTEQVSVSTTLINGRFHFGPEGCAAFQDGAAELNREMLRRMGGWMLDDLGVDLEGLREMLHPAFRDVVDELEPCESEAIGIATPTTYSGNEIGLAIAEMRVRDRAGQVVGTVSITKPPVGMNTLAMLTASGDLDHLERMHRLAVASRRPAAVLFADLEGSAQLSKRLPTAAYFALIRRVTRAADACVVREGGLVGRHAGDGVAAFFVAEPGEADSSAARGCISAARGLQNAMSEIAERHDLPKEEARVRVGLHWGSTVHIGSIITLGRTEVTALGDAVNEAARIEGCATGGRILASKDLIERLDSADAELLGVDPNHIVYTQLADLDTATDKARRDAPAIPVCDIANPTR
jgi:class 3 adenylate cyclase